MTKAAAPGKTPQRTSQHQALEAFIGEWQATGESFGDNDQAPESPRAAPTPWISRHGARWHTGRFFLVQDERATTGGGPFDTLSVMGVDPQTGRLFARTFENHGFHRDYTVAFEGRVWTFTGEHERARIEFSEDLKTQVIRWEWRPEEGWLPLCDRVATKVGD